MRRRAVVVADRLLSESLALAVEARLGMSASTFDAVATTPFETVLRDAPDVVIVVAEPRDDVANTICRETDGLVPVVVVTRTASAARIEGFFRSGALAIVATESSLAGLSAAVTSAMAGKRRLDPLFVDAIVDADRPMTPTKLSERERQILTALAEGEGTAQIAESLGLSIHTVRRHIASALNKVDAHSRLEAVVVARRLGLIPSYDGDRN